MPVMTKLGFPLSRVMLDPASAYEIQDNWHTTGLRGTGSNDYSPSDLLFRRSIASAFWSRRGVIALCGGAATISFPRSRVFLLARPAR